MNSENYLERLLEAVEEDAFTRITVAEQPERIGRRACGQIFISYKDLLIYQRNQNAKIGFSTLLVAPPEAHHSFWS